MKKRKEVEAPVAKPVVSEEENRRQADERRERSRACAKEVQAILEKYNCSIDVAMVVRTTGSFPQITIVAQDNA